MTSHSALTDLAADVFLILRSAFFDEKSQPIPFKLRDKRNTQDDPLDEYIHRLLSANLPRGTECIRSPGPLITPDLVIMRSKLCENVSRTALREDLSRIAAIEVKKLQRTSGGSVARSSGVDYNTTPPCGTVRVYDGDGRPLDIRGFYLFVCQEACEGKRGLYRLSALALCDGNLLNADFDYYLSIVGERTKQVELGTYGNGANRTRPMLIFANPLGAAELSQRVTLIHVKPGLEKEHPRLRQIGVVKRTAKKDGATAFSCYCLATDVSPSEPRFELLDPFPTPTRTEKTQPRGRFRLDIRPLD